AQIAIPRGCGADGIGFVGQSHVQGGAIDFTENGDGVDAQFTARPLDADSDFAAIGNQDFLEHKGILCDWSNFITRAWPAAVYSVLACLMLRGVRKGSVCKEEKMKRHLAGLLLVLVFAGFVTAQDSRTVAPPEPIVAEGVPPVPATLAEAAGRYSETR